MSLAEAPLLLGKFGPVKEQGHATQCLGKVDEKEYWKIPPPPFYLPHSISSGEAGLKVFDLVL